MAADAAPMSDPIRRRPATCRRLAHPDMPHRLRRPEGIRLRPRLRRPRAGRRLRKCTDELAPRRHEFGALVAVPIKFQRACRCRIFLLFGGLFGRERNGLPPKSDAHGF